jgi:hypothetical protein
MCAPKIPRPDPAIGEAAKQQAQIAQAMSEIAKDQLAWERERARVQDPLVDKIVNQQIGSGDANAARSEAQWKIYRDLFAPLEERLVNDANDFDSRERQDRMAAQAGANVARGHEGALASNLRAMERMGVNPNSGRFQTLALEMNLSRAKDTAGAMNQARLNTELQGMALREGAAKFGRNMPNTGLAADAAALSAGDSGVGNLAAGSSIRNANMNSAQNWLGGATSANSSSGNLMLGQHQAQLDAWQARQNSLNNALGGLGSLAGTLGGAYLMKGLRKGGVIRGYNAYTFKPRGYNYRVAMLKRRGYRAGGLLNGPGSGTSDSIPAAIEGIQPIRLSNGEAVLNQKAVELVGEDFIHRVNAGAGGLGMTEGRNTKMKKKGAEDA